MTRSSVVLPQPDGPMSETNSPRSTVEVDVGQRLRPGRRWCRRSARRLMSITGPALGGRWAGATSAGSRRRAPWRLARRSPTGIAAGRRSHPGCAEAAGDAGAMRGHSAPRRRRCGSSSPGLSRQLRPPSPRAAVAGRCSFGLRTLRSSHHTPHRHVLGRALRPPCGAVSAFHVDSAWLTGGIGGALDELAAAGLGVELAVAKTTSPRDSV